MNCRDVRLGIDDIEAGAPSDVMKRAQQEHLDDCPACRAYYRDVRRLQVVLRSEELPPLPELVWGRDQSPVEEPVYWGRWVAAAALLCLAFGVGFFVASERRPALQDQVAILRVPQTIALAIEASADQHDVTLRLILPAGTEVEGYPGITELAWQTDLVAGVNRLRIPLVLSQRVEGALVARVEYQGKVQELKIGLGQVAGVPLTRTGGRPQGG